MVICCRNQTKSLMNVGPGKNILFCLMKRSLYILADGMLTYSSSFLRRPRNFVKFLWPSQKARSLIMLKQITFSNTISDQAFKCGCQNHRILIFLVMFLISSIYQFHFVEPFFILENIPNIFFYLGNELIALDLIYRNCIGIHT